MHTLLCHILVALLLGTWYVIGCAMQLSVCVVFSKLVLYYTSLYIARLLKLDMSKFSQAYSTTTAVVLTRF